MCIRNGYSSGGFTPALVSFGLFLGFLFDLVFLFPNSVEAKARCNAHPSCPHHRPSHPARTAARSARGARRERCCARLQTRSCASCPPSSADLRSQDDESGPGRPVQGSAVVRAVDGTGSHPDLTKPVAGARLPPTAKPGSHRSRVPHRAETPHI